MRRLVFVFLLAVSAAFANGFYTGLTSGSYGAPSGYGAYGGYGGYGDGGLQYNVLPAYNQYPLSELLLMTMKWVAQLADYPGIYNLATRAPIIAKIFYLPVIILFYISRIITTVLGIPLAFIKSLFSKTLYGGW